MIERAEVKDAIAKGNVFIGMNLLECERAWGFPQKINVTRTVTRRIGVEPPFTRAFHAGINHSLRTSTPGIEDSTTAVT
jgi:hypothetical protein